jgi:hypothetical protein
MPKPVIGLGCLPTYEMQLICNCCGQPYYPDKAFEDKLKAIFFGTEKYAICPLCTQQVPEETFHNEGYRIRCRKEVKRLQRLYEAEMRTRKQKS